MEDDNCWRFDKEQILSYKKDPNPNLYISFNREIEKKWVFSRSKDRELMSFIKDIFAPCFDLDVLINFPQRLLEGFCFTEHFYIGAARYTIVRKPDKSNYDFGQWPIAKIIKCYKDPHPEGGDEELEMTYEVKSIEGDRYYEGFMEVINEAKIKGLIEGHICKFRRKIRYDDKVIEIDWFPSIFFYADNKTVNFPSKFIGLPIAPPLFYFKHFDGLLDPTTNWDKLLVMIEIEFESVEKCNSTNLLPSFTPHMTSLYTSYEEVNRENYPLLFSNRTLAKKALKRFKTI